MFSYIPETVRLDITGRCNLKCIHCQSNMFLKQKDKELSDKELKDIFTQLAKSGVVYLSILGGEPLLRKGLFPLLYFASNLGLRINITTNGLLLDKNSADQLMNGINSNVAVSLDGPNAETHDFIRGKGSFEKTLIGINNLLDARSNNSSSQIYLSVVVHKQNHYCAEDYIDLACKLGVDSLLIAEVHKTGRAIENWKNLNLSVSELASVGLKIAKRIASTSSDIQYRLDFFTSAFRKYLKDNYKIIIPQVIRFDPSAISECYIQHDGKVFPSQQCSEMIPEVLLGAKKHGLIFENNSLKNHSFKDIWTGEEFTRYRNTFINQSYVKTFTPCDSCNFLNTMCQPSMGQFLKGEKISHRLCQFSYKRIDSTEINFTTIKA